jgi:hypothetical protein
MHALKLEAHSAGGKGEVVKRSLGNGGKRKSVIIAVLMNAAQRSGAY